MILIISMKIVAKFYIYSSTGLLRCGKNKIQRLEVIEAQLSRVIMSLQDRVVAVNHHHHHHQLRIKTGYQNGSNRQMIDYLIASKSD